MLILWAGISGGVAAAVQSPAAEPAAMGDFAVGRNLIAAGDGAVGLPLVAAAVSGPDARAAHLYLLALLNQGCFDLDLAGLEAARARLPDEPALLECVGRRYEGKGRYDEAEAAFRHWADAHPELAEPYARLGELYVTAGSLREALAAFARYRGHNPGSAYAVRRMAAIVVAQVEALRPRPIAVADAVPVPAPRRLTAGPDAEAQFGLAVRYQHGLGVPTDLTLAAEAYARAARAGHPIAQLRLANLLQDGQGVARDPEQAARWLTQAARKGLPEAQLDLALACLTGDGLDRDFAGAVAWSERAAVRGLPEAQFLLGTLYRYGIGTPRDADAAGGWLMKAGAAFLEAGRWTAGRQAVTASIELEGDNRARIAPRLTAVDNDPAREGGNTP